MSIVLTKEAEAMHPLVSNGQTDFKAWAKRFIYRYERGDKELTHIQIRFAHEALDMKYEPK